MALSLDALKPAEPISPARSRPEPVTPPENRLSMPTQSLSRWSEADRSLPRGASGRAPWLARIFVFGGALLLTIYGAREMYEVVSVSRTTLLQYVLLVLFVINFSWIALAFTSAVLGFAKLLFAPERSRSASGRPLTSRNAIVMPVYNEATARTFAAVEAIRDSIEATGQGAAFDYFILSDSTNPNAWIAEERAFIALREKIGPDSRIYYRHREKNYHRKAGNIADFVTRWGGAYEHMIVLDADSLMTGECVLRLVEAMEDDPARVSSRACLSS
jgi:membrane glycosyltransferase